MRVSSFALALLWGGWTHAMIIDLPYQKIAGNTYPWYRSMDRFNFAKGGHVSYKADIWSLDGYEEIGNSTSLVLLACKPEPARQVRSCFHVLELTLTLAAHHWCAYGTVYHR